MPQIHCHQAIDSGHLKSSGVHRGLLINQKFERVLLSKTAGQIRAAASATDDWGDNREGMRRYRGSGALQEDSAGGAGRDLVEDDSNGVD